MQQNSASHRIKKVESVAAAHKKQLITLGGGENCGVPCESLAYHEFYGLNKELVSKIADLDLYEITVEPPRFVTSSFNLFYS